MIVLDENILADQRLQLGRWRVKFRQIGKEVGPPGLTDEAIIALLLQLRRPTFFTRDRDFFQRDLCHERYCLVWLDMMASEVAQYVRRVLRHPELNTQVKRLGAVVAVSPTGLDLWRLHAEQKGKLPWII